jgi:hypothetical protein
LSSIEVPTLVIHGTADPMFPIEHGEALAEAIPGAGLLPLEGAGHGVDRADWEAIVRAILKHTAADDDEARQRLYHRKPPGRRARFQAGSEISGRPTIPAGTPRQKSRSDVSYGTNRIFRRSELGAPGISQNSHIVGGRRCRLSPSP